MNRLEAIRALRSGDVLENTFVGIEGHNGRFHTYTITVYGLTAVFHDPWYTDKRYRPIPVPIKLSFRQLLGYIQRHYPRRRKSALEVAA